jgi:putative phage-type endonuclease
MDEFRLFLHANQWKGTHVRKQMKKFALLARRTGSTFSKTYQELAQAWNMEESR